MMLFVSSHVRFSRTGSCASAFQKFVTLSVLRVAMMSSYTARTSGLAFSYSMNPRVDMHLLKSLLQICLPAVRLACGDREPETQRCYVSPPKALAESCPLSFGLPDPD